MKTITIRVTADDIKFGLHADVDSCPIARAMGRATGKRWRVSRNYLWHRHLEIKTPVAVRRWIRIFDHYLKVKPFTFKVRI